MFLSESDILQVTETVWDLVLHMPVQKSLADVHVSSDAGWVRGTVHLEGSWNGWVVLACPMALARRAAGIMYNEPPDVLSQSDVCDAIGELTNMLGGNVRALLPEPCALSLPSVQAVSLGRESEAAKPLVELCFTSEGLPFHVRLADKV